MTWLIVWIGIVSSGPTTLTFSGGERGPWQCVTANGELKGTVPGTPLETPAGCYGMGRLFDRTLWVATEQHFYTSDGNVWRGGVARVETMAGSSGRHLYRIVRGQKRRLPRPQIDYTTLLEELDPATWTITRWWLLPGGYLQYGAGHLAVDPSESVAYYTTATETGTVHRYDLRREMALPDLVASPVGSGGLLVFQDGSIVVGYRDGPQEFDPDGTHRRTYPFGPIREGQGLLAHGSTDRTFWTQGFEDGTPYSTLYEYDRDGEIRHQWNTPANGVQWDAPFVDEQRWRY